MTGDPLGSAAGALRPAEIDAALDLLHHAIDRLEALFCGPSQRTELDSLRRSALSLADVWQEPAQSRKAGLRQFEPARFQRLLALAGPESGAELLARLAEDLAATRQKADAGWQRLDWAELRGASHVLISLAGSVGAVSLQSLAEHMNLAAQGRDRTGFAALLPEALQELDALIAIVARTRPVGGRGS